VPATDQSSLLGPQPLSGASARNARSIRGNAAWCDEVVDEYESELTDSRVKRRKVPGAWTEGSYLAENPDLAGGTHARCQLGS
jgi:hypothetical protein